MAAPMKKMSKFRNCIYWKSQGTVSFTLFKRYFGQPIVQTHPHLIGQDEVTPGINKQEYQQRRTSLISNVVEKTAESIRNHIMIFPSASKVYMTYDIPYPFRQNTEFLYLSGFQEPDSVLVLQTTENGYKSVLFVPKRDPDRELWDGPRSGDTGAVSLTGVSEAHNSDDLEKYLHNYCKTHCDYLVWYSMTKPVHLNFHKSVISEFLKQEGRKSIQNPIQLLHQMRLVKSQAEIKLMKKTCQIASEAFVDVMRCSHANISESTLYAKMDYECRVRGAEILAYPPVVAGAGELVLMDAGCEYHGYTSDITRTWPVSGKFTPAQRRLYLALLDIQEALVTSCRPGVTLAELYQAMMQLLAVRIILLDLVPSSTMAKDELKMKKILCELCPHDVGHYLGMDVHDTPSVSKNRPLEPGMVITIEPGLYIKSTNTMVPEEYRGIGIRIEDNVLITEGDPIVLTADCPKHPDHIEAIMAQR
ncbi:XPP3-like protein [Mya arenaria]|uniref:XPP3-like protein n=1 Tax=Mya arenaria TaxID=6604 RepID=A0ABY7DNI2_MYAAR|nr:XPP3-like protein [Mya arenaria]